MLKTSFELLNDSNREEHPLSFLSASERCYAFAKGSRGFFYVVRSSSTWKIMHVSKRNQKTAKLIWRRFAPEFTLPVSADRLAYFEKVLKNKKVKLSKPRTVPRDYQRQLVYEWEHNINVELPFLNAYVPIHGAMDLANIICKDLNLKPIKVKYIKQRANYASGGLSYGSIIEIYDCNLQTVLHEIVHVAHIKMMKQISGRSSSTSSYHGPEFMAFYVFLFERYANFLDIQDRLNRVGIIFDIEIYEKLVSTFPLYSDESCLNSDNGNTSVS